MDEFPVIILSLIIVRPLNIIFHELGHAIPGILFTKKRVAIFIGSYGNRDKGLNFSIGLLDVYFIFDPITRQPGLCSRSGEIDSLAKRAICTAMGPCTSLLIALLTLLIAFWVNSSKDYVNFIFMVLFLSSIIDFIANIIPSSKPIVLYNGGITYNDGYQLRQMLWRKKFPDEYANAVELYKDGKYAEALVVFEKLIDRNLKNDNLCRLAFDCYLKQNDFKKAKLIIDELLLRGKVNSDDYCNAGLIYSRLEENTKALDLYDKSLALNPANKYTLNNKGYLYNVMGNYAEAIPLFDKAIEADKTHAYSFNNRGLARIKLGQVDEGLQDIRHSMTLDANNSYCYLHLGIYHFDKKEYKEALSLFEKAKEMDKTTYKIEEHLTETRQLLNK